jgi:hypothetical protein
VVLAHAADLRGVAWSVGGVLSAQRPPDAIELIAGELAPHRLRLDVVDARAVQADDLGLALSSQRRIAVALLELLADLKRPETRARS